MKTVLFSLQTISFILMSFLSIYSFGQVKKPNNGMNKASLINKKETEGPFKPEDYKYYVIVERKSGTNSQQYYKLGVSGQPTTLSTIAPPKQVIVLDIRSMKELSWWPSGSTYFKDNYLYVKYPGNGADFFYKFNRDGKPIYGKRLEDNSANRLGMKLSEEWNRCFYFYNNDVWSADFDSNTGKTSNFHQVTKSGVMNNFLKDGYMKFNTLSIGQYLINMDNGNFDDIGFKDINSPTAGPYIAVRQNKDRPNVIWNMQTREKIMEINTRTMYWTNRENSRFIMISHDNVSNPKPIIYDEYDLKTGTKRIVNWKHPKLKAINDRSMWFIFQNHLSPNSKYFFGEGQTVTSNRGLRDLKYGCTYIYDTETLSEEIALIDAFIVGEYKICWTDDTHLIFSAEPGYFINNKEITTSDQGTYIYDIKSKEAKRITPYFININGFYSDSVIRLPEAGLIIFEANNLIFQCEFDGSDLKQITQTPDTYKLVKGLFDVK